MGLVETGMRREEFTKIQKFNCHFTLLSLVAFWIYALINSSVRRVNSNTSNSRYLIFRLANRLEWYMDTSQICITLGVSVHVSCYGFTVTMFRFQRRCNFTWPRSKHDTQNGRSWRSWTYFSWRYHWSFPSTFPNAQEFCSLKIYHKLPRAWWTDLTGSSIHRKISCLGLRLSP